MKIEEKIIRFLIEKTLTISTAESCTGGLLASRLTDISGSSRVFMAGVITYSNETKTRLLKVPADLIRKKGAVSEDVALAMAKGVQKAHKTHFGIGITGIAGPTGGTRTKPVGLVYIAIVTPAESLCLTCQFSGTRTQIKRAVTTQALELLLEFLE